MERHLCSWTARSNSTEISILPNATYKLKAITINIPKVFLQKEKKKQPRIHIESQRTPNSQTNLEKKKEQSWRTQTSGFQNLLQNYSNQESMKWA